MSLSGLLTAVADYVADVLVNECGRPVPDRVFRYHGRAPQDCCTDAGVLDVSWDRLFPSTSFPTAAGGSEPCPGAPVTPLTVRYTVCWPVPELQPTVLNVDFAGYDALAAELADVADCVSRWLLDLSCDPFLEDPYVAAIFDHAPRGRVRLVESSPILPAGGCAGVQWRLNAAPTAAVESVS